MESDAVQLGQIKMLVDLELELAQMLSYGQMSLPMPTLVFEPGVLGLSPWVMEPLSGLPG